MWGGYAQETPEVTLDFTSSSNPWKFPERYIKDGKAYTYTYNGYTITIQGGTSGAAMWTNEKKNYFLQLYRNDVTLSLPAFDFAVSKIVLDMYSTSSGLKQNIYVDNVAVSTEVSGNKSYSFDINPDKQAANTIYQIKNSGTARIQKIHIYKAGSSKTPTTTTFGAKVDKQTFTITEGETFPTHVATMTTEGVAGNIAYASDNAAVNVDQNGVTSAGTGFGTAKITATFTPTDAETYASSSAYYYIDYKDKTKPATAITFEKQNVTLTTLDYASFTGQTATLKAGETTLTNELAYSKEDAAGVITTLNNDGTLVLSGKAGTATVTATFNGSDEYAFSTASYTVTVKEAIKDIATLKPLITATKMASAQSFTLKLTDAVVTYVNRNSAYIQDATAGIFVYASGHGLKNNQKINGLVDIKALLYSNLPEISSWALDASAEITDDATFDIETVTIADLNANYSKYESKPVKIAGAIVTSEFVSNKAEISQDGNTYLVYNKGGSGVTLTKNDNIDIIGYPTRFNDEYNLYLWKQSNVKVNSTLVATTLSFDPATTEYNVDNNNKDAFTAPTATVKDAEGNIVEGAAITYISSEPGVATVGETDGKVTFVGFGTTVITASYAGDATHMDSKNSYTINYGKVKTTMTWSATTATANLGETSFDAPTLTLKAGDVDILDGKAITYSSSATDVAEISAEGTVTINAEGTTVITATFAGDDTYAEASASYTLTVTDPNKLEVTFDFTQPDLYGYVKPEEGKGTSLEEGNTINSGVVTITNVKSGVNNGSTNKGRFWNSKGDITLRLYDNAQATISVPEGYILKKVTSDAKIIGTAATWSSGKVGGSDNEWVATEDVNSVTFTVKNAIKMASMTVYYANATSEATSGTINFIAHDAEGYYATFSSDKDVVFTNDVIVSGVSITGGKLSVNHLSNTEYYEVTDAKVGEETGIVTDGYYVPANTGVLVYCSNNSAPYYFPKTPKTVTLPANQLKPAPVGGGEFTAEHEYKYYKLAYDNYTAQTGLGFYWGAENAGVFKVKAGTAYLAVPTSEANNAKGFAFDGETTGVENMNVAANQSKTIYNLNGQRVSNMSQAGLYIVNGKKVVIRK